MAEELLLFRIGLLYYQNPQASPQQQQPTIVLCYAVITESVVLCTAYLVLLYSITLPRAKAAARVLRFTLRCGVLSLCPTFITIPKHDIIM